MSERIQLLEKKMAKLEILCEGLIAENTKIKEELTYVKGLLKNTTDYRFKDDVRRVLGFTLSKYNDTYHAVRSINGKHLRFYIGKNCSEDFVRAKIIKNLQKKFKEKRELILACSDLFVLGEIQKLLEEEKDQC